MFNLDFPDKELFKIDNGNRLYTSKTLEKIWGHGFCIIGDVTFDSAAYVARYIMKKITNTEGNTDKKGVYHPSKDEYYHGRPPEYATMSRNGGIAKGWFQKWSKDVYPDDFIVVNGKKVRPPKFYDNLLDKIDSLMLNSLKQQRKKKAMRENLQWFFGKQVLASDNNMFRLAVKEEIAKSKISALVRDLE